MTRAYHFYVEGQPIPKARPRVVNGHAFTPDSTRAWESKVAHHALMAARGDLLQGDIKITLSFARKGKRRADLDNLCKAIFDACNGVLFSDDKQIVRLDAQVLYEMDDDPLVIIEAEEMT